MPSKVVKKVQKTAKKAKVVAKKPAVRVEKVTKIVTPKEGGLKITVYSASGRVLENMTLPKEIFGQEINNNLMAQAVRVFLANQRRGTSKTKSRGEVNISTRKIYRQKGTGRARHGAASAPIFVGGGIAFGPKPRDYSLKLTQKMRKQALISSLSAKAKDNEIKIVSGLEKVEPKTKIVAQLLKKLQLAGKNQSTLLVTPTYEQSLKNIYLSVRNIKGISVRGANLLNTYEVLAAKNILFMKSAIENMKELAKN